MKIKTSITNITFILIWYTFVVTDLALFLYGFFPLKNAVNKSVVPPPTQINEAMIKIDDHYHPEVTRVVIMIIDALRVDFITERNMPYLHSNVNKEGCFLTTRAQSPTVTMPRIKAMTTGSVPQFIDIALNFASSEIVEDSLLRQAKLAGKNIVFYGDNTWLKLFPDMFLRSEGTTSFYVSDYTEVDNNVTRHLPKELKRKDWDLLFLHYLGLDHIGHMYGPSNPLIGTKLLEMDTIIQSMHLDIKAQDSKTLILICGDHGMGDFGGHGGSTDPETLVPLAFLGVSCDSSQKEMTSQTDIAPTIAVLMGLTLPGDNVGRVMMDLVNSLPVLRRLYALHYNALNLIEKNRHAYFGKFEEVFRKHEQFVLHGNVSTSNLLMLYNRKLQEVSENLVKSSSEQKVSFLYISCSAMSIILLTLVISEKKYQYYCWPVYLIILIMINLVVQYPTNDLLLKITKLFSIIPLCGFLSIATSTYEVVRKFLFHPTQCFIIFGTIVRIVSFASTSLIEEEHDTWYFLFGSFIVLATFETWKLERDWRKILPWIGLFAGLRFLRHLNHVGKWAAEPDIGDWLQMESNRVWFNLAFITGLIGVVCFCTKVYKNKIISVLSLLTAVTIFWYRTVLYYYNQTVIEAQIAMLLISTIALISLVRHGSIFKTLTLVWILWSALLMRPHNIILIPACISASIVLKRLRLPVELQLLLHIWLASVLSHCQGFSNSIASIDISPGYVGLADYSPVPTAFQIICHTYSFKILVILLLFSDNKPNEQIKMLYILVIYRVASITYFCIMILLQREHLFVWSVFAPKLLVETGYTVILLFGLIIYQIISYGTIKKPTLYSAC